MRNQRGLTLIELVIVLAVIAIIGAILIPNYLNTTDKARLKSDVQSARVLQNALELYNAEQSVKMPHTLINDIIGELGDTGYIEAAQAVTLTDGAKWALAEGRIVVDISACDANNPDIRSKIYNQLSQQERMYVKKDA